MFFNFFCFSRVFGIFLFSLLLFLCSILFFLVYSGKSYFFDWEIFTFCSTSYSVSFILDWVGVCFSCVVLYISFCVFIFSSYYMDGDKNIIRFVYVVFLFVTSMNFLIYIPNLVSLLIGWDGLGLVSFCLVIYYQNFKSNSAGMVTVLANRVGDVMLLLSIGWFLVEGHWYVLFFERFGRFSLVLCFCIIVAGMTKSAQIPFSSWLPAAMAAPTPVSALVHSSTLVTAGVFLLIRFYSFLSSFSFFFFFLLFISVLTMFMAGVSACFEMDMKKVIALSTLSQLGVMMSSLALGLPFIAFFHLCTHALFKALLFLCAGSFISSCFHVQDFRHLGGLSLQMPLSVCCMNIANLALCGSPFLAGFYSKDLILEGFLFSYSNLFILFLVFFATGLTACYSVRFSLKCLWGVYCSFSFRRISDENPNLVFPLLFLTLGAIFSGSFFSWFLFGGSCFYFFSLFFKLSILFTVFLGFFFWLSS